MPFEKFYEVDFTSQQQANPILNTKNWPPLQITQNSASEEHHWKPAGLDLKVTRNPGDPERRKSVYVVPPGGLTMHSRYLMKVTFLHPNAGALPASPNSLPEQWAIGLRFSSLDNILDGNKSSITTCQFGYKNSQLGVRLSTPRGLQGGDPGHLEYPIDYSQYNPVPPHDQKNPAVVPVFILEQSFCGINLNLTTNHTTGAGFLKISRPGNQVNADHRVFSQADFTGGNSSPKVNAMGVNLAATNRGSGWISIRLLTLEIWEDKG